MYNNYSYQPGGYYQPNGYYFQNQGFSQPSSQGNAFAWVQGEAGAKAYPVNPGTTAWLMDSENNCFYIKTVDQNGVPQPLEIYDYSKRQAKAESQNQNVDMSQYVRKDELETYINDLLGGNVKNE